MLSLVIAAVMGFQQAPTITFKSNFESLEKVVERLARETQIPMAAYGDAKSFPIYINVKDVPVKDLLDRIAVVSGSQWEKKGESYYLTCENMLKQQQSREGDGELISAINATINQPPPKVMSEKELEARFGKGNENPAAISAAMAEMFKGMFAPDDGALKMLQQIGAKDLSTLVEGRRVVLSSNPNSMQGLLKAEAVNAIRANINKLAATSKSKGEGGGGGEMFMMMFGGNGLADPDKVGQAAIFMATFQMLTRNEMTLEIGAYTATGEGVYKRMMQLPITNPQELEALAKGVTPVAMPTTAALYAEGFMAGQELDPMMGLVTGGGGITALMSSFSMGMDPSNGGATAPKRFKPIPKEILAMLQDPEASEPMSQLLGPVMDAEAARGRNVIAMPSDEAIKIAAPIIAKGEVKLESTLAALDRSISQKITTDGTWTTLQASSPLELRSAHCKRKPLHNLLKAGAAKGYVNLDDCASFATVQDSARGSELLALPLITASLRTSDLGSASALTKSGFDPLKLYWSLSDHQKQQLNSKRPIPLAALNPQQTAILARMVFNGPMPPFGEGNDMTEGLTEELETETTRDPDDADGMGMVGAMGAAIIGPMMSMFGMNGAKIESERTVLLPNGIPVVGSIQLHSFDLNAIQAENTADDTRMIGPPELFEMFSGASQAGLPFMQGMHRTFDRYKLAKQKTHILIFKFAKVASYMSMLYDVSVDQSKSYTKDQLPQKMKERMDRLSKIREDMDKEQVPPPAIPPAL